MGPDIEHDSGNFVSAVLHGVDHYRAMRQLYRVRARRQGEMRERNEIAFLLCAGAMSDATTTRQLGAEAEVTTFDATPPTETTALISNSRKLRPKPPSSLGSSARRGADNTEWEDRINSAGEAPILSQASRTSSSLFHRVPSHRAYCTDVCSALL